MTFILPKEPGATAPRTAIRGSDYRRLVVCGHSLGGSVSLLLGMKLRATWQQ